MRECILWLLLASLALTSSLPCCKENLQMIPFKDYFYCQDYTNISANCANRFFAHDPLDTQEGVFHENIDKTQYTFDDSFTWRSDYCTGIFLDNSLPQHHTLASKTGKMLALICFPMDDEQDGDPYSLYATCLLISSVFLLLTLTIYLILPELLDLQGKCVLCFILSLMIGYLCLAYLQLPFTSPEVENNQCIVVVNAFTALIMFQHENYIGFCVIQSCSRTTSAAIVLNAFLTYFWMISAFFWLNINSFNMWRSAVLAHISMSERRLMLAYYSAGWGFPLIFLAFALITHHMPGKYHLQPNFGVRSCWFKGKFELWSFFYGPVLVLLILNIIYFISTALYLWKDYRSPNPMPRVKSLRIKFCLYFKLFLVMGITWIFEILSSVDNEPWYVTDILNCFQGVIIFVVMIVLRKRVWRALAAKKFCNIQFNNCWEKMEDEETVNEVVDEQQLSTNTNSKA